MTTRNTQRRTAWLDSGPHGFSDVIQTAPTPDSFHASLNRIADEHARKLSPLAPKPTRTSPWVNRHRSSRLPLADRIVAWLRARPALSAEKKLQALDIASMDRPQHTGIETRAQSKRIASPAGQLLSWFQARYKMSATKRLRVAEVASLGDKRFVALVSVEGREFLIGGGASGVSLLTPLRDEVDVRPAHSRALQSAGECE